MAVVSPNLAISHLTDTQLLDRYREEKNNKYLGELYKRYAHLVYSICNDYVKDHADCEDVMMIVFEKMLAHLPVDNLYVFKQWLLGIARNESLVFLRNRRRQRPEQNYDQAFFERQEDFLTSEESKRLETLSSQQQVLHRALRQLPSEQRRCLELFYLKEMSYKDIEENTNFSAQQVKSYLQNGKRQLKKILSGQLE